MSQKPHSQDCANATIERCRCSCGGALHGINHKSADVTPEKNTAENLAIGTTFIVKTTKEWSAVAVGTTATAELQSDGTWKISWNQDRSKGIQDYFIQSEFDKYLEVIT